MRCQKCGFIGFDYLNKCKKCGADLTAVRDGFGFMPAKPSVPSFLGALTGGMSEQKNEATPSLEEEGMSLPEIDFGEDLVFSPDEPMEAGEPAMAAAGAPAPELRNPVALSDEDLTIELEDEEAEKDLDLDLDLSLDDDPVAAEAPAAPVALDLDATVSMNEVPAIEPEDLDVELDLEILDAEVPPPGADVPELDAGQLEIDFDYNPDLDAQPQAIPRKPSPGADPSLLSTVALDMEGDDSMEFVLEPVEEHLIEPVQALSGEEEFDLDVVDKELGITLDEEQPGAGPDASRAATAPAGKESEAEAPQTLKITSDDSDGLVIEISEDDLEDLMVNLEEGKLNRDHKPGDGGADGR